MVTKYSGYIHTPATRATGYVEDPDGRVVLATDYAAIEAERDEWKRRCERICNWIDTHNDNGAGEALYAIAEGRE